MWLGLAKMAFQTGAKVYANKQRTKQAMSDAALLTAEKQARGEIEYNKLQKTRPVIGTAVLINGLPKLIPMVLKNNGRWNRKITERN